METREITSFEECLRLLGGPSRVGRLTGRSPSAVCQWRTRGGKFPAECFLTIMAELEARGLVPALALFRFDEVANEQAQR